MQDDSLCLFVTGSQGTRKYFPLDRDGMTIGRDKNCDISLSDTSVSKFHGHVKLENGKTVLYDGIEGKPSSNGIFVNDRKIDLCATIDEGSVVKIGIFRFEVRRTSLVSSIPRIRDIDSVADICPFLEKGELAAGRERDVLDLLKGFGLGVPEIEELFNTALDTSMSRHQLARVAMLSKMKQMALHDHKSSEETINEEVYAHDEPSENDDDINDDLDRPTSRTLLFMIFLLCFIVTVGVIILAIIFP